MKNIPMELWEFIEKELNAKMEMGSDNSEGGFTYLFEAEGVKWELKIKTLT